MSKSDALQRVCIVRPAPYIKRGGQPASRLQGDDSSLLPHPQLDDGEAEALSGRPHRLTSGESHTRRRLQAASSMAGDGCNGNGAAAAGVVVPEIKFTKLFINGEFVDAVSGTCLAVPSSPPPGRPGLDRYTHGRVSTPNF